MALVIDRELNFGDEIAKCKEDFVYFCESYLKILDRNSKLVSFKLKPAQLKLLLAIEKNPWQSVLKARQLGSSTLIAALFFWKTLFTPNERTLVVAHTAAGVGNIFRIYQTFYDNLPKFLQFNTKNSSANQMIFFHGGTIRVSSATGQSFRGATYNNLHCSEVAFWKDLAVTVAGLFQTATGNSCIILETTANGLNQFHSLWVDDNNGFDKTFLSWTDEPEYIYKGIIEIPQIIEEYGKEHGLTKFQLKWAAQTLAVKCANSFITFQQEYAIDPITCFVSSGTRFFNDVYPDAKWSLGYKQYAEKKNYGVYILGADTASGSPTGDYSAFCVIDVFNNSQPTIVATYAGYNTPIEFGRMVLDECKKWNATAVIESNSYGLSVVEVLVEAEWGKIYTNQRFDDMTKSYTTKLGFNTNAVSRGMLLSNLQETVNSKNIVIIDDRIKYQMNTFVYDASGRPDHMRGTHDDLLFSLGLALMGIDQAMIEVYTEQRPTPKSVREVIEIELKTGFPVSTLQKQGYFEEKEDDEFHVPWS